MIERTRAHERVADQRPPGQRFSLNGVLPRPVEIFVPAGVQPGDGASLLVHFHGATYVAEHAVAAARRPYVLANVNVAAGGGAYEHAFDDPAVFDSLLAHLRRRAYDLIGVDLVWDRIVLSGFSAGYGAVRALLRERRHATRIDGVLLLDGLHTSYVPDRTVLHEGGRLDEPALAPFLELARAALTGEWALLITHSEVFPGTFASTTECVDYILDAVGLSRTVVLEWGPVGMQQLSEARTGRLRVMGFAGNSAPDHLDHLHGLPAFLRLLDEL